MIQGRGLVGERMDPMVKVKCGKHTRQTLRTKGTYNPFFDEVKTSIQPLGDISWSFNVE